ncbi:MAG: hypothetical protein PWP31_897 [Clostridia bacterium]|nr:hypothetical protein [Clostridia bacterium]
MKVAITSQGKDFEAATDPRFGRCQYFMIVDSDSEDFEVLSNDNIGVGGGAGIATAQMLIKHGVEAVLTGNVGPNAIRVLQGAGISVYTTNAPTVWEALKQFQEGNLEPLSQATAKSHFGRGKGGNR